MAFAHLSFSFDFGLSSLFASYMFLKGTYAVLLGGIFSRVEPHLTVYCKHFHRSAWFLLLHASVCCFAESDTSAISMCLYWPVLRVASFLLQDNNGFFNIYTCSCEVPLLFN